MTTNRTNKLKCIVTGRTLIATKDYYKRKLERSKSEDELHNTYICREAKNLLKQGVSVDRVREILEIHDTTLMDVSQEVIDSVMSIEKLTRINRNNNIISTNKIISNKTDDKVREFIKKIIKIY